VAHVDGTNHHLGWATSSHHFSLFLLGCMCSAAVKAVHDLDDDGRAVPRGLPSLALMRVANERFPTQTPLLISRLAALYRDEHE